MAQDLVATAAPMPFPPSVKDSLLQHSLDSTYTVIYFLKLIITIMVTRYSRFVGITVLSRVGSADGRWTGPVGIADAEWVGQALAKLGDTNVWIGIDSNITSIWPPLGHRVGVCRRTSDDKGVEIQPQLKIITRSLLDHTDTIWYNCFDGTWQMLSPHGHISAWQHPAVAPLDSK